MERKDLELITKFGSTDPVLSDLYRQHMEFECELEKLDNKSFLTTDEQFYRAELKKKKLAGKDKIERLLSRYRLNNK